jgi:hypothetical protein
MPPQKRKVASNGLEGNVDQRASRFICKCEDKDSSHASKLDWEWDKKMNVHRTIADK